MVFEKALINQQISKILTMKISISKAILRVRALNL
jgi:hypothetical protein